MLLVTSLSNLLEDLLIFTWDLGLATVNLVTPKHRIGHVTPRGTPGAGGKWPEYVAPKEGDSRSACPALNALANHGILPHDGKNIKFSELSDKVCAAYNFAPTAPLFVTNLAVNMLKRDYKRGTFDLSELDLHNGIEHDASLTREDVALVPDQGKPHVPFVRELLASASGKDGEGNTLLTPKDISKHATKRRVDSQATDPEFSLDFFHKLIGNLNSSFLLTIFGGRVDDLQSILIEERIPEGWESRVRQSKGLTLAGSLPTFLKV